MSAATRPRVIQSQHPVTHTPEVIGLGGEARAGATTLPGAADNWLINVQPIASEPESAQLQPGSHAGLVKPLSHLDNRDDPL